MTKETQKSMFDEVIDFGTSINHKRLRFKAENGINEKKRRTEIITLLQQDPLLEENNLLLERAAEFVDENFEDLSGVTPQSVLRTLSEQDREDSKAYH